MSLIADKAIDEWLKAYTKIGYKTYSDADWEDICEKIVLIAFNLEVQTHTDALIIANTDELTSRTFLHERIKESRNIQILHLFNAIFCPFEVLPLEINSIFKEVVAWRLDKAQ